MIMAKDYKQLAVSSRLKAFPILNRGKEVAISTVTIDRLNVRQLTSQ